MWLLPLISRVSSAAVGVFYRTEVAGGSVPPRGAVLLVANHPNSLIDPAAVAAAAGRPVRFLAKAPLFGDRAVGWLVRGSGSIPVYRRADDPGQVERNDDTFRAAHAALADGDAVGIFPEGLSHSEPALAPLRTGAARIALGAAPLAGGTFPIVPVGLSFRDKTRFRSEALVLLGEPIEWADLAAAGIDPEAVRELTARIERGLRNVTVNLESWEDAPLVEAAEEIYAAEILGDGGGAGAGAAARVQRVAEVGDALRALRSGEPHDWEALASAVRHHDGRLRRIGIRPHQLRSPGLLAAAGWVPRQAAWMAILAVPAAIGAAAYYLPYRITGAVAARATPAPDVRATYKLLTGALVHLAWTFLLAAGVGSAAGAAAGVAALLLVPLCGGAALVLIDRWRRAEGEAHRFVLRTVRRDRLARLRARQTAIAARMEVLRRAMAEQATAAR